MRTILEIRKLPMSELTDEEIAKGALDRLNANAIVFGYSDKAGNVYFFSRYKNKSSWFITKCRKALESVFGKMKFIR